MAGATSRVEQCEGFRVEGGAVLVDASLNKRVELGVDFIRLLGGFYVVIPLARQLAGGVGHQPKAAEAVLYQVLDDPVGGEELGGGGDVFAFHHLADDLIFLLADVELVEPADDFDLLPVGLINLADQWSQQ